MTEWDTDEVVVGKFPMPIPKDIMAGSYELWLTVLDQATGEVLVDEDGMIDQDGLQWINIDELIQVDDQAIESAKKVRRDSLASALDGQCLESWNLWKTATHHVHRNRRWRNVFESEHQRAVASCFLERAKTESDPLKQQDLLLLVRKWDHNVVGLLELVEPVAAELDTEGQQRMASEEWGLAYEAFAMSMALDPTRSHTRRRAEEARDKKLKIVAPHNKEDK